MTGRTRATQTGAWTVTGNVATIHFASLGAAVEHAEGPASTDHERRSHTGTGFFGTQTWQEALTLASEGWAEGRDRVARFAARMVDDVQGRTARVAYEYAETGPIFDLGAYLDDDPFCMQRPIEETEAVIGRGPIVRIVANVTASGMVSASVIERRGAAVAAVADALEHAGRRAEIIVTYTSARNGYAVHVSATVKAPDQPINMDVIAFALAHPASLRRIGFAIYETAPEPFRTKIGLYGTAGYGYPAPHPLEETADVALPMAHGIDAQWSSDSAAETFVVDALRKQGAGIVVQEGAA